MRQIKFRAWDDGKMVYEKDIQHLSLIDEPVLRLAKFWCNIRNDSKVMQFTGLKDRSGVDIYEGDIVKTDLCHPSWVGLAYEIVFQEGAFQMKTKTAKGSLAFAYHIHCAIKENAIENQSEYYKHLEVIGNIYEHSKLLTNE